MATGRNKRKHERAMTEQQHLDFVAASGEEFGEVLSPIVGQDGVSPQDCYDVLSRVLGRSFSPTILSRLDDSGIEQLRQEFSRYFELDVITTSHIKRAIDRILHRWPPTR
jgi:hypothetical protein